jgi:hypothetical protein
MGVKYLPFYQVPFNIISLKDFFFDAGNLKGPGPIIMIAALLLIAFAILHRKKQVSNSNPRQHSLLRIFSRADKSPKQVPARSPETTYPEKTRQTELRRKKSVYKHELVIGLSVILLVMILFYYIELYNIFPMNVLSSIQYHRIIPEFVIMGCALVACLYNVIQTRHQKIFYYSTLIAFVIASSIIIYNVQEKWQTTADISNKPEFIQDQVQGRISFPYTDQSLSVRNDFTFIPQVYGYYEQGITNPYTDEIFSASSGYHDSDKTIMYLKAANVGRLYVNVEEGDRDQVVMKRMNTSLVFVNNGSRYGYFIIPLKNPSFAQAVDGKDVSDVQTLIPGCRVLFKVKYCGSTGEEFVSTDPVEVAYLRAYVDLMEKPYSSRAEMNMDNPDHYTIDVKNATKDTAIVVKMTYDKDFRATLGNGQKLKIEPVGPYFMLIHPQAQGDYTITLEYGMNKFILIGFFVSTLTIVGLAILFIIKPRVKVWKEFPEGDLK